nr:chitin-binding and immunoglobulin domain containing protein [Crepidula fornicata]
MANRTSISSGPYDSINGHGSSSRTPGVSLDTQGGRPYPHHHHHHHPSHRHFEGRPNGQQNYGFSGDLDRGRGNPDPRGNPPSYYPGFGGIADQGRGNTNGGPRGNHTTHYPGGNTDQGRGNTNGGPRGRVSPNGGPKVNPPVHFPGYTLNIANNPQDHPSWEPSDESLLYPSSNPSSGYPAYPEPDYLSVNGPSVNSRMDERLQRQFDSFPPLPDRPGNTTPKVSSVGNPGGSESNYTEDKMAPKTRGRFLIIIVAIFIIVIIGTAVGVAVPLVLQGDNEKIIQRSTIIAGSITTSTLSTSSTPTPLAPGVFAYLREATRLTFELPINLTAYDNITIFNDDAIVATFNVTGNDTLFTHPRMLVSVESSGDSAYRVNVTLTRTECGDGGQFVVASTTGDDERESSAPVSVRLRKRPTPPTLRVPEQIAETHTTDDPVCSVASLDYPRVVFSWAIRQAGGNSTVFPTGRQKDVIVSNETSCESSGNSTFSAYGYENWNNSDICCQLRDAESDEIYFETCKHLRTVPADYCESGEDLKIYPFETCFTFVDCQLAGQIHFKKCEYFCVDVVNKDCSRLPETTTTPPPSPPGPYNCNDNASPYLPLSNTYPDHCHSFQRCVGDRAVREECQHGQEYTFQSSSSDSDIVCSLPADDTYCGKKFLEEDPLLRPMARRTGQVGGNVSLHCVVTRLTKLKAVSFLRETSGAQVSLATLNTTDMTSTYYARGDVSVTYEERGEGRERELEVVLTFTNVTCGDVGDYVCVARGGDTEHRQSAKLQSTREPQRPTLEVPGVIVEKRTTQNPVCKAGSLGYRPNMGFAWVLRRPGGLVDQIPDNRETNLISERNCNAYGNSTLKAQRYVTWGGSQLCCQLRNSSDVTVLESCKNITVLPPVELPGSPVAPINQPFSLECLVRKVSSDVQVEFFHDSQLLATYNGTSSSDIVYNNRTDLSVQGVLQGDLFTALLNFSQISCSDKGNYTCRAVDPNDVDENGDPIVTESSTVLKINRPPGNITLEMVCAAEGITYAKPKCTVASLGHNPTMYLTWTLIRSDGSNQTKENASYDLTTSEANCDSSVVSKVKTDKYRGWNNTHLCCQLRHPDTSEVVKELCEHQTVIPGDYCGDGSAEYKYHPYDRCSKFVQCANNVVYCSHCNPGLCFNLSDKSCN